MSSRKHIRCFADYPFAQYPDTKVPWDDVYLTWKGKPGRKTYRASPCLECDAEVKMDLKMHEEIRNREGEWNALDSLRTAPRATKEERQSWYREDDAVYMQVLKDLETSEFAESGKGAGLCIYTKSVGINKREAERMMAWWLEKHYGIRNPKFVWNKPKTIITPMGFGSYPE